MQELLELVGLREAADRRLKTYSGGMKQRVGIAQALLGEPKLLIVDEPTAGLDPEERVRLRNLPAEMAARCTVILSTHIVEDVSQSCSDLAVIREGQIVFRGHPRELMARARGHTWHLTTNGERPDSELMVVSTLTLSGGTQYRVLGSPPDGTRRAGGAEPGGWVSVADARRARTGRIGGASDGCGSIEPARRPSRRVGELSLHSERS